MSKDTKKTISSPSPKKSEKKTETKQSKSKLETQKPVAEKNAKPLKKTDTKRSSSQKDIKSTPTGNKITKTTTSSEKQPKKTSKATTSKATEKKQTTVKKVVKKKLVDKTEKDNIIEKYLEAGKIAIQVKQFLREKVKVGASVLELCNLGEAKILELGGKWAFPVNISINNIAAHYSAPPEDDLIIQTGDIVKVDCGVHIDGYVADTAFTVSFGKDHTDLIKASEEATKAAIDLIRPGISTDRIGTEIDNIIRSYDFRPIRDLTGHQLEQNLLHGTITIPNISGTKGIKLEEGQAFAIETFATTGTGTTHPDETKCFIYQLLPVKIGLRLESSQRARKIILANYKDFPFTTRWIAKDLTYPIARLALQELSTKKQIRRFPALCDVKGSFVSQNEHTVYLTGNTRIITTLPNQ